MKILLISTDTALFDPTSAAVEELLELGIYLEQVHVIIFSKRGATHTGKMEKLAGNIFLYPTNSRMSWSFVSDAVKIAGKEIVFQGSLVADIVEAEDPFFTAYAAQEIARIFKRGFVINVPQTLRSYFAGDGALSTWRRKRAARSTLPKANGIRTPSQLIAEDVSNLVPHAENYTYIVATPQPTNDAAQVHTVQEFRAKYPQFNLLLLTVIESGDKSVPRLLSAIIRNMRLHYPKMGLVVIDNEGFFNMKSAPEMVWEKGVRDFAPYFEGAHVFIDASSLSKPGGALMEAATYGCPIVATPSPASEAAVHQDENGFVADAGNLADFSGKIVEIFERPGLRERIKLFRLEMDKLAVQTPVEYHTALLEVWQRIATNTPEPTLPQTPATIIASEDRASLAHTLSYTREYVKRIANKINKDMNSFTGPKKIIRTGAEGFDEKAVMDVDTILK